MNKIYRLIWNAVLGAWVPASELTKKRGKRATALRGAVPVMMLAMPMLYAPGAQADTDVVVARRVGLGNYENAGINTVVSDGSTVNLTGQVEFDLQKVSTRMTLEQAIAEGYVTGPDVTGLQQLTLPDKSKPLLVPDPIIPGAKTAVSVYDDAAFAQGTLGGAAGGGNNYVVIYRETESPYLNARLGTVSNGKLNINLAANSALDLGAAKQTTLVKVDGTQGTNAEAVWESGGYVSLGQSNGMTTTPALAAGYIKSLDAVTYQGVVSVTDVHGALENYTVTNLDQFKAYNKWLVAKLEAGDILIGNYDALLKQAYTTTSVDFTVTPWAGSLDASEALFQETGVQAMMHADGPLATARVTAKANAPVTVGYATALLATNGGTVINDGRIGVRADQGNAMVVYRGSGASSTTGAGSTGINNGVITVGYSSTADDASAPATGVYTGFRNIVDGEGSTLTNNGVINTSVATNTTATSSSLGINTVTATASYKGTFINKGAINLGVNGVDKASPNMPIGLNVITGGSAINDATGVIYVGRGASGSIDGGSMAAGGADTIINGNKDTNKKAANAIQVANNDSKAVNNGTIVLGSGVQGGAGLYVHALNSSRINVVNNGTIDVNGVRDQDGSVSLANQGIYVYGTTNASNVIDNAGTINLNGTNGIGIQVVSGGVASNSGTINVSAPSGGSTGQPNYGLWAQGTGSTVNLSGTVNLNGDNAIGVHARDGGSIKVSGGGNMDFGSGTHQTGYFIHGATAKLENTGSAGQLVDTEASTLYRMAAGAEFNGTGSASTLEARGKDSVAVVVTGKDGTKRSAFTSGGMQIDLTGDGATGVIVEGGAVGTIDTTAKINLAAENAIAGIVDGQAHDTLGNAVDAVDADTVLNTGAALGSSLDGITGYVARNGASLNNTSTGRIEFTGAGSTAIRVENGGNATNYGDIVLSGQDSTGLLIEDGGTATNHGNISVTDGGVGLQANSSSASSLLTNHGTLTLAGGDRTHRTIGVSAEGSAVTVDFQSGSIDMQGQGAIGVQALDGAKVTLSATAVPKFSATESDQIAFRLSGAGSTIQTNAAAGTVLDASGIGATLFRLDEGAQLAGQLKMKVSGSNAQGIAASGAGTVVDVAGGSAFDLTGEGSRAVSVSGGATVALQNGTTVDFSGDDAVVGVVDGNTYDLSGNVIGTDSGATLINHATLSTTTASNATALVTQNHGILENHGNIDMSATTGNTGVAVRGGTLVNYGDIAVNGTALRVEGSGAVVDNRGGDIRAVDGTAAVTLGNAASLDLIGSGLATISADGNAHGVLVEAGASALSVQGATLNVLGNGNGIENQGEIDGIELHSVNLNVEHGAGIRTARSLAATNSGSITVEGAGAGIEFMRADGSATDADLDLSDSASLSITANAVGGRGIVATTSGDVSTAAKVNIDNVQGGAALVVNGSTQRIRQSGVLVSASTVAPVVEAGGATEFVNAGEIRAADAAQNVIRFDADGVAFTNEAGGVIQGALQLNDGNNTVVNNGEIAGTIAAGAGDNTVTINEDATVSGTISLGDGDNRVLLVDNAEVADVRMGTGDNALTLRGNGQTFGVLDGGVGGSGTLNLENHQRSLTDATVFQNFDQVNLRSASKLTLNTALATGTGGTDEVGVDIDADSTLAVATAGAFALNNRLTGTGSVQVDTQGEAFDFTGNTGDAFAGNVALGNTRFDLSGQNTTALTAATLSLGAGSTTVVGTGSQAIGGLAFAGGTAVFDVTVPADREAATTVVTSGTLDLSGSGVVQVNLPDGGALSNDVPVASTSVGLLEQDDQTTMVQLARSAGTVVGTAGNLALVDQTGAAITDATQLDITQGGTVVAKGTYDYRLMAGTESDGLYVGYGLKELDVSGSGADALVLAAAAGATGAATDLSARLTGTGDIAIEAGGGNTISLSNGGNDFSGESQVRSGTLRVANDNALGNTSRLAIESGAAVALDGHAQTIGALTSGSGASLDLGGGTLEIIDGGSSEGEMKGAGTLRVAGGTLAVQGDNAQLSADTVIADAAIVAMDAANGLGTGAIHNDGVLSVHDTAGTLGNRLSGDGSLQVTGSTLRVSGDNSAFAGQLDIDATSAVTVADASALGAASVANDGELVVDTDTDWSLENAVSGDGSFTKAGVGTLTVGDALSYTGATAINAGVLIVGDATRPDVQLGAAGAGEVTVKAGATLAGLGVVSGNVRNEGSLVALNSLAGHGGAAGTFTLAGDLDNHGVVTLAGSEAGNTLRVEGNYTGNGGTLVMNTVLGDDTSVTDRMVVAGDTAGTTQLQVRNAGGAGAQTANGIQLVSVGGSSEGTFLLQGRAVAGLYDYQLQKGSKADPSDGGWYLRSELQNVVDPDPEVDPTPEPTPEPSPEPNPNPGTDTDTDTTPDPEGGETHPVDPVTPIYRPEPAAYLGNQTAAVQMFQHSMHDRVGEQALNARRDGGTWSAWTRVQGRNLDSGKVGDQIAMENNATVSQVGIERRFEAGEGRIHAGVMGGSGRATVQGTSDVTGYQARGEVKGRNVGAYATWFQNATSAEGAYVDGAFQYGRFDNTVEGEQLGTTRYDSRVRIGSLEAGYAAKLHGGRNSSLYIEPQVQVVHTDFDSQRAVEANGTEVRSEKAGGTATRVGARLFSRPNDDRFNRVQPFVAVNWWNGGNASTISMDGEQISRDLPANVYEAKVGANVELGSGWSGMGQLGMQRGSEGYRDVNAQLGVKFSW